MKTINITSLFNTVTPKTKLKAKDYLATGSFPVVSQESGLINGYYDGQAALIRVDEAVIIFGDHTRIVKYVDFDFVAGADGTKILKPSDGIDARYLYYLLLSNPIKGLGYARHFRMLKELEVPEPPSFDEQRRVVERLDAAFEKIDRAIELTERNINYSKSLYRQCFSELFVNVVGEELKLVEVCSIQSKLIDPRQEPYIDYLHIGGAGIESETGALANLKTAKEEKLISSKFPFDENMVLYSKIRPYLRKVVRPNFTGICSADVYPLLPSDKLRKDYLYYLLLSNDFTNYAIAGSGRAGMPKVNRPHLFSYEFTLPSLMEQDSVVKELDDLFVKSTLLITKYNEKLDGLSALKQSMLTQAFSESDVK